MPRLKLYLDDCAYSKRLRQMLLDAEHQVVTPFEAGIVGFADSRHFDYACQKELVIVTKDADDFEELHRQNHQHFGILTICEETDRSKNMNYGDIVRAIENIISANVPLPGQFYILNHWRW